MIKLTNKITKEISKNLMIDISDEEAKVISELISKSVEKIEKIKEFNFEKIKPMDYPNIPITSFFRDDEVKEFKDTDDLLELAPEKEKGLIKV